METIQAKPTGDTGQELELVLAARGGDISAFEKLLQRYDRNVFRIAQHITQNREDAEDVVQEAFLKAYTKLDQFEGNSKFYTWLVRIAVNEALMKLRKRKNDKSVSLDEDIETEDGAMPREVADWSPNPEQLLGQSELRHPGTDHPGPAGELPHGLRPAGCGRVKHRRDRRDARVERTGGQVPAIAGAAAVARPAQPAFPAENITRESVT